MTSINPYNLSNPKLWENKNVNTRPPNQRPGGQPVPVLGPAPAIVDSQVPPPLKGGRRGKKSRRSQKKSRRSQKKSRRSQKKSRRHGKK